MTQILVVDDSADNQYLLDTILRSQGFSVTLADNGQEALEKAGENQPDLIIADILMPVMDGFSLCRRWMADPKLHAIPFVFYSATYTEPQDIEFGLRLGACRYIVKPIEPGEFLDEILGVLNKFETGLLPAPQEDLEDEPVYLKVYNERLVKQLEQKMQQADAANRRLRALFQLSASLALLRPESELIEQALTAIAEAMGYTRAHYWTFDPAEQTLRYLLAIGEPNERSTATRSGMTFAIGQETGLVGLAAADVVPVIVNDVRQEPRWIMGDPSIRSALLLPVVHDDTVYGVCTFVSTAVDAFSSEDAQIAAVVSNTLATAIENVRLYQEQLNATNHLEDVVAERTSDLAVALKQAQAADRLKSQFVSDINHELRTPLTTISLNVDLLPHVDESKRTTVVGKIKREILVLTKMIEDLLDLSRYDLGATTLLRESVQLDGLIRTLLDDRSELAHSKGLQIRYEPTPNLPPVQADQRLIFQVLSNLLVNAIHYTQSGEITLRTGTATVDDRQWCTVAVSDTGPGIPLEEQAHLFERFFRGTAARESRVPGTGLGLAICQEILDRHDGRVSVESVSGEGSTFTVWLPNGSLKSMPRSSH